MRRYDFTASIYDSRYQSEQEAKYAAALGCISAKRAAVLDVGCGSGLLFDLLSRDAEIIVGVDASKGLLAKGNARARQLCNVHIVQADADYLPLKPGFFGVVFAFTVLQNMPEPSRMLSEIAGIAKPGAQIVITALKKVFSKQELEGLLARASLKPTRIIDSENINCYVAVSLSGKNTAA